jgi:uncharacterized protein (TIGR03437 family)
MPTQLGNVSVTVNGKPAFVSFISTGQVNVLSPLDGATGPVAVVVTNGGNSSAAFTANLGTVAPAFLRFGATYIAATHGDNSLLGPASMSVPGYPFTPAQPGETIVLYAVGFGLPTSPLVNGASTQSGTLPNWPVIQIGGAPAEVKFAGIISPGLTQINVIVPPSAANGDNAVTASYGGATVPAGAAILVQR